MVHGVAIVAEIGLGLYIALIGCIFFLQRKLMYFPVKDILQPSHYGLPGVSEVPLTASDGVTLQAWVHRAAPGFPTVVYFHGNAFHLGNRAAKFAGLIEAGFGLIAVGYRGFGRSGGKPSEQGIYRDARAAVDYALGTLQLPPDTLIYFGESLGSGVAVQMAIEHPPALLVLEAAYTSVETRSAELYPFVIGAKHLVLDKYDSLKKISGLKSPLLMLHGALDATIPLRHGQTLFAAAPEPKQIVVYPTVNHADYNNAQILTPLLAAAQRHGLIVLPPPAN
jgi:fermentation-respiration switch protein FrsA (DUF1100 family)